jgi:hypothetical protein
LKLKQREFLALKQGNMSVNEYLDKFTQLSRYAPDEVNTDPKRQERFLDGLIGPLNYQLQSHTFPDFATLLNKAIGLENNAESLGSINVSFNPRVSPAAIPAHATATNRIPHSALEDIVESTHRTCSCSVLSSSLNDSTRKLLAPQTSNRTAQLLPRVHRQETPLLCSLMDASNVASWDIMLITVLNMECRLPRGVIFRKLDSHQLQRAPETQVLRATKHSKIMCAAGCIT